MSISAKVVTTLCRGEDEFDVVATCVLYPATPDTYWEPGSQAEIDELEVVRCDNGQVVEVTEQEREYLESLLFEYEVDTYGLEEKWDGERDDRM